MISEIERAKNLTELQDLKTALNKKLSLECQIIEEQSDVPINSLVVLLEPDSQKRSRLANLTFLPLEDTDLESIKLLQFYCQLPISLSSDFSDEVLRFLARVNLQIPLGTFTIDFEEQKVGFKYVYSLGKFKQIEPEEFLETFLLWMYTLDKISDLIEAVSTGQKDVQSACQELL
jgi:hypothetical protein